MAIFLKKILKMKIIMPFVLLITIIVASSCSSMKSTSSTINNSKSDDSHVFFKASGNEPFWGLAISENSIKITTMEDSVTVAYQLPLSIKDSNAKRYNIVNAEFDLNIEITHSECLDDMSGDKSPYSVSIDYKRKGVLTTQKMKGCGKYITDYRLHDIWALEILNGKKVEISSFQTEIPSIEIDAAANSFMGFAGCNHITGQLLFEKDILNFTKIISTMMHCGDNNKEKEFLSALSKVTKYKIENNRLILSDDSKELLIFLKVD